MRSVTAAAVVITGVACGSPARPTPEPVPAIAPGPVPEATPAVAAAPAAAPTVVKRIAVAEGRRAGTWTATTAPDGAISIVYDIVENGRGPHVEATLQLASDGTPRAWTAIGHHTMGTTIAETFSRTENHARWQSKEETGEADAGKPTFFVPIADGPVDAWLVPAALKVGGTIALWPAGETHVEKIAEVEVDHRKLVGYTMTGFDLIPSYTWFDADGTWFGQVAPGQGLVPEGWEKAIEPLVAKQVEIDRARGETLAKTTAHHPPAAGVAFTHARVLDVVSGKWIQDQTVVVVGDKITALGARPAIPAGAEVVDLAGKALLPGLIDMHSHTDEQGSILGIASGVTTVRDVGNDPDHLDDMKARFDAGTAVGPHIVRMGFIEGRNPKAASSKVTAETPEEAKAAVEFFAKRGYEGIKIYNSVPVALVPLLAADAHKRGMLVTGHIPVHMLAHEAIDAGYDGIEHINMIFLNFIATHDTDTRDTTRFTLVGDHASELDLDGKPVHDFIKQLLAKHVVIDPTLDAFEDLYTGVPGHITPGLEDMTARLPLQLQRFSLIGGLPLSGEQHAKYMKAWDHILAMVKTLWAAKVAVVAGTDSLGGISLHHELALLAACGIPNAAVLRMTTIDAARAMRQDNLFGSIKPGKRADLIVVDGDPLADITAIRKVVTTMRSGVMFATAPLYAAVSVRP